MIGIEDYADDRPAALHCSTRTDDAAFCAQKLKLNMTRGKPLRSSCRCRRPY